MAPPYSENVAQIYLYNVYKTTAELTEKQKITVTVRQARLAISCDHAV